MDNGIPCIPFYENKQDRELKELTDFLLTLLNVPDIRPHLKEHFKFRKVIEHMYPYEAINDIFKK